MSDSTPRPSGSAAIVAPLSRHLSVADVQGEPVSHPWGLRDFQVLDLEGNRVTLGQPFE
jgi:hypothetical protein